MSFLKKIYTSVRDFVIATYETLTGGARCPRELLEDRTRLLNRNVIVTGGTSGIGYQIAQQLVKNGANVIITGTDERKGQNAVGKVQAQARSEGWLGHIEMRVVDHSNLRNVQQFAHDIIQEGRPIHMLYNNAALVVPSKLSENGFNLQMQVNYLAHFVLTVLLLDVLERNHGRVINTSSSLHEWSFLSSKSGRIHWDLIRTPMHGFNRMLLYHQSKIAMCIFSEVLAKRSTVFSASWNPGPVAGTDVSRTVLPFHRFFAALARLVIKSPWQGAQTGLYLGLEDELVLRLDNGKYFNECHVQVSRIHEYIESEAQQEKLWHTSSDLLRDFLDESESFA